MLVKVTVVKIVNYVTSVCDQMGGDVTAYIGSILGDVCMSHSSGVAVYSRTVRHTHNKDTTNICSHITTHLITHRCNIIDYFKNCNFNKHG